MNMPEIFMKIEFSVDPIEITITYKFRELRGESITFGFSDFEYFFCF